MGLRAATAITWTSPGRGTAVIPPDWGLGVTSNGGYLLALAARAALEQLGAPWPVTTTAHLVNRCRPGTVEVVVDERRTGPRHRTATSTVRTGGVDAVLATVTAATSPPRRRSDEDADARPAARPALPAPDDCWRATEIEPFPATFFRQVDVRLHPDDAGWATGDGGGGGRMRGWFRVGPGEPVDPLTVLLAADALPPTSFNLGHRVTWTPTVSLTVDLLDEPDGEWLACSFTAASAAGGYLSEDGEIWSGDRLVARVRQVALLSRR